MVGDNSYLKLTNISKRYGVVQALDNVSFSVRKGEIHTILGENGAGKSTLIKIIMGEATPDTGEIELDQMVMKEYSPLYARNHGVQMVHQELATFENLTVAENIFPWHSYNSRGGLIDWKLLNQEAQKRLDDFGLKNVSPEQLMSSLSLDGQQMVEIIRCLSANPKVLLLDEPTSGLNDQETDKLMNTLKRLRDEGQTILYISHRLKEILEISDRVTILRDGQYIDTLLNDEHLTEQTLINSMVGRDLSGSLYKRKQYQFQDNKEVLFRVNNLSKKNALIDASFELKKGEILGFFGLEGSGTDNLSRMIYGLDGKDRGEIFFEGEKINKITPNIMAKNKIMYLYNNRKIAGLLLDMPVTDNIAMSVIKQITRYIFVNRLKLSAIAEEYINKFSIAIPSLKTIPRNLSGGNQQKVMLAICLAASPKLLIVNEPTRGIDVGAKVEIHKLLLEIAQQGVGVIVFSSELPELLSLADRIVVMKRHEISGEMSGQEIGEQAIMSYATMGA